MRCMFCIIDSAGNHESNCPNYTNPFSTAMSFSQAFPVPTFNDSLREYAELLKSYKLTLEMINDGEERFSEIAPVILKALNRKIKEILELDKKTF